MKWILPVLLLLSVVGAAQQLPDAPMPSSETAQTSTRLFEPIPHARVMDKRFFFAESAIAASLALDAYSTAAMNRGCHETNKVLGRHPSNGAVAAYMGAQFVGTSAVTYAMKKRFGDRWHGLTWLIPTLYVSADHARAGMYNYAIGCE
jgi:hypothetical protein